MMDRHGDAAAKLKDLPIWVRCRADVKPLLLEAGAPRDTRILTQVFHAEDDIAMPVQLSDRAVMSLNTADRRRALPVRYTRYVHAPGPPDPRYSDMIGHASYDLAYRDAALYQWLLRQRKS